MSKISIIVPIYKTGLVLKKTLKSIRNQTFIDFECLLVDDGSKDSLTTSICKEICKKDARFQLLEKENEGIEKTRLFGVHHASSPLIMFCDHDDYYEKNAMEILYKAYKGSEADIVVANCFTQKVNIGTITRKKNPLENKKEQLMDAGLFKKHFMLNFFGIHSFSVSTWGKLYKKSLFSENFQLFGINILEDVVLNIQLFELAKKIHFIPDFVYTHVYGGISSEFNPHSALEAYEKIYPFRKKILEQNNHDLKPLLIEYKNIIVQRINLMIDHHFNQEQFFKVIDEIEHFTIYMDMMTRLSPLEKGPYLTLLQKGQKDDLFIQANSAKTFKRSLIHQVKKIWSHK
ncbi:MAG TPA: hypothetical protein DCQ50_13470 [Chryseobacterium sp.]|nr:hypothetical protein [Chryseobacterium sp.]